MEIVDISIVFLGAVAALFLAVLIVNAAYRLLNRFLEYRRPPRAL